MSTLQPDDVLTASWQEVEDFLSALHERARAPMAPADFYRQLLEGCLKTLAAVGGVVWQASAPGKWQPTVQLGVGAIAAGDLATHLRIVQQASEPNVISPGHANLGEHAILIGAVMPSEGVRPQAVIELFMRAGASPATQHGWEEFLGAVIHAAEEFELRQELRTLRGEHADHADELALLRRIHKGSTLKEVAYDIANEGSKFLGVDRLSVLVHRGNGWRLIAASGVDRLEARADAVKDLESLAEVTAYWGEPLDYEENTKAGELPPAVVEVVQRHVDHSHVRRLVTVPVELRFDRDARCTGASAVLIAEIFGKAHKLSRQQMVELAQLCEPALKQVLEWDRWPIRPVVNWTNWATRLWSEWGVTRLGLVAGTIALGLLALVLVRTDFEIEGRARLLPRVVQDVFATSSGTVREIKVAHGEHVEKGTVLAVLDDPQLDLEMERVRGELATVRKRLEAIAVARTDRQTREELTPERLPLSAEAKQLELRQASLVQQAAILEQQREELILRSPIDGMVLTLDVQNLLRGRPVERGQVLFTVGDTDSGWQLETRVPQDRIGHVVSAAKLDEDPLAVRFRLAGDRESIYSGHVTRVAETAVLDTEKIGDELPDVRVDVAVDEETLPAARPEMEAVVRVNCGRRSIGYVWLHDAWDNIYSWLAF